MSTKTFKENIQSLNSNKYLWGLTMLFLNLGSRHVSFNMGPFITKCLKSDYAKYVLIFCIIFIATRDVLLSLTGTFIISIIVLHLFNENSNLCILPNYLKEIDTNKNGEISEKELNQYIKDN